ncbi:hypothetical protein CBL_07695 [Carabus blaptoides fortunei]
MNRLALVVLLSAIGCSGADEQPVEARDSYIDAYHESHNTNTDQTAATNPNDRESKYSPYYEGGASGPGQEYGPPGHGYPETPYPPPAHYGAPMYGPPAHGPSYPSPFLGMPHAMLGLLDKFHLKLDIFTVLKIILKLVIFKKIVSFIAILCLLLFIPKFKMSKGGDEDDDADDARSIFDPKSAVDARLNTLTQYVLGAIENYSQNTNVTACDGTNCDVNRMLHDIDNKYSYDRLMTMYIQDQS